MDGQRRMRTSTEIHKRAHRESKDMVLGRVQIGEDLLDNMSTALFPTSPAIKDRPRITQAFKMKFGPSIFLAAFGLLSTVCADGILPTSTTT